jgi:hypothetical protein
LFVFLTNILVGFSLTLIGYIYRHVDYLQRYCPIQQHLLAIAHYHLSWFFLRCHCQIRSGDRGAARTHLSIAVSLVYIFNLFLILTSGKLTLLGDFLKFRIDFEKFNIAQPNSESVCSNHVFLVGGTDSVVSPICGENKGQHSKKIK